MMKIILFLTLLFPTLGFSSPCKVDGISDSAQTLVCSFRHRFQKEKLSLHCEEDHYYFYWKKNKSLVTLAYHEEVEEGPSPLVFRAGTIKLTVTILKRSLQAELEDNGNLLNGTCAEQI
jgi:hypothetical protein